MKNKKDELFSYQNQLKLGHKDLPSFFKVESSLEWITKIWKGQQKYEQALSFIKSKGYADKNLPNSLELKTFLRDIDTASTELEFIELLQNFKQETISILNIIEVCRLVSAETLQ